MSINFYHVWIVWFAGLVRGAIAFGLILSVDGPNQKLIKITCLSLVLITMMLFGGVMPKFISILLPHAKRDDTLMRLKLTQIQKDSIAKVIKPKMTHLKAKEFIGVDLDSILLSVQKYESDKSLFKSLVIIFTFLLNV